MFSTILNKKQFQDFFLRPIRFLLNDEIDTSHHLKSSSYKYKKVTMKFCGVVEKFLSNGLRLPICIMCLQPSLALGLGLLEN